MRTLMPIKKKDHQAVIEQHISPTSTIMRASENFTKSRNDDVDQHIIPTYKPVTQE